MLLDPRAVRSLKRLDRDIQERVKTSLRELEESPETKGEQLHPSVFWKTRIGDYRAIYFLERKQNSVIVLYVGHRNRVYDEFERFL